MEETTQDDSTAIEIYAIAIIPMILMLVDSHVHLHSNIDWWFHCCWTNWTTSGAISGGINCYGIERKLLPFPPELGGLGFPIFSEIADSENFGL